MTLALYILTILVVTALALITASWITVSSQTSSVNNCVLDGSCLGGNASFEQVSTVVLDAAGIQQCIGKLPSQCIGALSQTINDIAFDGSNNFDIISGTNIAISPQTNGISVATTQAISVAMLAVSGSTLLGTNTSCVMPLLPSCYDISSQSCTTPLQQSCIPSQLEIIDLLVHNLTLYNATTLNVPIGNQSALYVDNLFVQNESLGGAFTCTGSGSVSNTCLNLGGYTCPSGMPLADSCIPASLPFYDVAVTNTLSINNLQCLGASY